MSPALCFLIIYKVLALNYASNLNLNVGWRFCSIVIWRHEVLKFLKFCGGGLLVLIDPNISI
jgi:hypothetical protein